MMRWRSLVITLVSTALSFPIISYSRTFGQDLCKTAGYFCLRVKNGESWASLWPNDKERRIVMRINRMNTQIWGGMTIAVPTNLSSKSDILDYSPFPRQMRSHGEKVIIFDPKINAWGAYDSSGTLVRWGPASGGADWCRDIGSSCHTQAGNFRISSLGPEECESTKFPLPDGGAPMPYCMYFNNGQAFHGEPNGVPGYNASHGCVRIFVSDAEWMRFEFAEAPTPDNNYHGTRVVVAPYTTAADEVDDTDGHEESRLDGYQDEDHTEGDIYNN